MKYLTSILFVLTCHLALGQVYIATSVDRTSSLQFTSTHSAVASRPQFSSSLLLARNINLSRTFFIMPEINLGFLAWELHFYNDDWGRVLNQRLGDIQFLFNAGVSIGQNFILGTEALAAGVGGGFSYYFPSGGGGAYGTAMAHRVFYFTLETNPQLISPFITAFAQYPFAEKLFVRARYVLNRAPSMVGDYIYYSPSGNHESKIDLKQESVSLALGVRI